MNRLLCSAVSVSSLIAFSGTAALAQQVISAKSGLIHYVEGRVLLDGKPVEVKLSAFPEVKQNMELRTEDGRAEVLLNPGVFLRLAENSSIRMVENRLSDSRVEFLSGSAMIEASAQLAQKENSVTILYKGSSAHLLKSGLYRFDSQPAEFRVYSGEAQLDSGTNILTLKAGKMVSLDGMVAVEKFNPKDGDALSNWSQRRGEYISMANVSAAKYVNDSGGGWSSNGWYYNPYFGMFTYVPMNGMFYSPYGYAYYSPGYVYRVYQQPGVFVGRNGFGGGAVTGVGNTGFNSQAAAGAQATRTASMGTFGGSGASVGHAASVGTVGGGHMGGGGGGRSK
jgi:hypothetical protein